MFFKFKHNDIFYNQIKTHPNVNFKIYDGKVYYNNKSSESGSFVSNVGGISTGKIDLYENNVDRPLAQSIYPFITKNGSLLSFKTVSTSDFNSDFLYGDIISSSYPLAAGLSVDRYLQGTARSHIDALRNVINNYSVLSKHYSYSSSLGNKATQEIKLISIPSIFYGSSIEKGSVSCKFYITGTLTGELIDDRGNGELRQRLPTNSNSGSIAGVVLYKEGFICLTGSWSLHPTHTERYNIYAPGTPISPRWLDFGTTGSSTPADLTNVASSSFELGLNGTNYVPVLTMFAHANKGQLNYSNNPTFITYGQTGSILAHTSSTQYIESDSIEIKNIVKSNFIEPSASFDNTTYISRIGIYDKNRNLIAIAKLSSPIRKKEIDSFSFKIKIDW